MAARISFFLRRILNLNTAAHRYRVAYISVCVYIYVCLFVYVSVCAFLSACVCVLSICLFEFARSGTAKVSSRYISQRGKLQRLVVAAAAVLLAVCCHNFFGIYFVI